MSRPLQTDEADFVIIGSGASGATAAVEFSENHFETIVVEEGEWYRREDFTENVYGAMATLFRDFGNQMSRGRSVIPVLEGCCVGGSTVMNGAIVHRLPEEVHASWLARDPGLVETLSYNALEKHSSDIESELQIGRNLEGLLPSLPVSHVLQRLGWKHQAMLRNAPGCQSTGRCLQGCPTGGKWSMEVTFIPRAVEAGARVYSGHRAESILWEGRRAVGVRCRLKSGGTKQIRARRGVVLAGGVMQTPRLLWRSGLGRGASAVGKHFQTHLGISIVAEMTQKAVSLEGPPQGIEITEFSGEKIKLATQLVPPELLFSRTALTGESLREALKRTQYYSSWTGSIQSESEGELRRHWTGNVSLVFTPTAKDMERVKLSLWNLSQLLFEMGARKIYPGIHGPEGFPTVLESVSQARKLLDLPLDPRSFLLSVGHLFGTSKIGSDPNQSVVDPDFQVHGVSGLFVVDAGVFPSNLGVNPQHSVMAIARAGAQAMIRAQKGRTIPMRLSGVKSEVAPTKRPMSKDW